MPLVKVDIAKGQSKEFLIALMNTTMACIREVLQLPSDENNIRLSEFDPDFFRMKAPYKIIIEISMFSGRTKETKALLFQTLVAKLNETIGIEKDSVYILITEQSRDNYGIRGGQQASEVDLGFKVEI